MTIGIQQKINQFFGNMRQIPNENTFIKYTFYVISTESNTKVISYLNVPLKCWASSTKS